MTDGFRWHPMARLIDSNGVEVSKGQTGQGVLADSPAGLANAIGHPAFRIGATDRPAPRTWTAPIIETLTSGSTGQPRRIRRTQASWLASFAINAHFGIGPDARVAVLGRLVHSLSLYGAIEGLHLGAEVHLLDALRPDRQSTALSRHRITHLYATPAQLRLLTAGQAQCPDLQLILIGGSKLDPALRARLAEFAPQAKVHEFYGAAETSFISLADAATPDTSVGRPYPEVELRIGTLGEIWVRSPYLFLGYADEELVVGRTGATWRDGWLSVGEIGSLEGDFLYLRGRAGRMVTVADQNVFPEEIELFLQSLPGVMRAAVLPAPDSTRGHILIAVLQGDARNEPGILAALRHSLGPTRAPKILIWRDDWPVLASGKTDLTALEAMLPWPA
jgi:long-chain acyl-CoA synthetase